MSFKVVAPQGSRPPRNKFQPLHVEEARSGGDKSISEMPKVDVA